MARSGTPCFSQKMSSRISPRSSALAERESSDSGTRHGGRSQRSCALALVGSACSHASSVSVGLVCAGVAALGAAGARGAGLRCGGAAAARSGAAARSCRCSAAVQDACRIGGAARLTGACASDACLKGLRGAGAFRTGLRGEAQRLSRVAAKPLAGAMATRGQGVGS